MADSVAVSRDRRTGIGPAPWGGRMPGYHRHAHQMSAAEYLDAVVRGDLKDPVITFLLRCGRTPVGVAADYLEDEESCNYGALMEWKNPFTG